MGRCIWLSTIVVMNTSTALSAPSSATLASWRLRLCQLGLGLVCCLSLPTAHAGPLAERWKLAQQERWQERQSPRQSASDLRIWRDVPYGDHLRQRMDIYVPHAQQPIHGFILLVHGGAWRYGDKQNDRVVDNKVQRWVPLGFIVMSINYRLLPEASLLMQVQDVRHALRYGQHLAAQFHLPAERFVLMGHSAGAHLLNLVNSDPQVSLALGVQPWLGVVSLDSAVMDVPTLMQQPHLPLYDEAFGTQTALWRALSPYHQLQAGAAPSLLVCSTTRPDQPCQQAQAYAQQTQGLGNHSEVLPQALSHAEINEQLGLPNAYTQAVERFLGRLHPSWASLFAR